MKKILLIANFTLSINLLFAQTNFYDSIYLGSRWRTFMIHLPTGYNSSVHYQLVLVFHSGGAPNYQSIQYQSRLTQKADSARFYNSK